MQLILVGFQENPKQLDDHEAYHIFTTSICQRDRQLQQHAALSVEKELAIPKWLNWSEQPITWRREDHPQVVNNPGAFALVVAPQVRGYTLHKVLMDGGTSINILYYDTFRRMGLTHKHLQ